MIYTEWRLLKPVSRDHLSTSLIALKDSESSVVFIVSPIVDIKKNKDEKLGKKRRLEMSVTTVSNDKKKDEMLIVEGFCLTTHQRFRVSITREEIYGGYGLMSMPCIPR